MLVGEFSRKYGIFRASWTSSPSTAVFRATPTPIEIDGKRIRQRPRTLNPATASPRNRVTPTLAIWGFANGVYTPNGGRISPLASRGIGAALGERCLVYATLDYAEG